MKKTIYLTIDDAPSSHLKKKVDFLHDKKIPAIFYCRGEFMEKHLDGVVFAIQKGFLIGNHSYSHPYFSDIDFESAVEEIQKTEKLINKAYTQAGQTRPYKLFRFPFLDKGEKRGQAHAEDIQNFLSSEGFQRAIFPHVNYKYYQNSKLSSDIDAPWTFDAREYALFSEESMKKHNLSSIESFVLALQKESPEEGFGLNNPNSSDIVLLHDFETTHHLFEPIMNHLISRKIQFALPEIVPAHDVLKFPK